MRTIGGHSGSLSESFVNLSSESLSYVGEVFLAHHICDAIWPKMSRPACTFRSWIESVRSALNGVRCDRLSINLIRHWRWLFSMDDSLPSLEMTFCGVVWCFIYPGLGVRDAQVVWFCDIDPESQIDAPQEFEQATKVFRRLLRIENNVGMIGVSIDASAAQIGSSRRKSWAEAQGYEKPRSA